MTTSETKKLNKKDLLKVFWRSFTMEWTWNYERQANLGYGFAMVPIIEKLYKDKPEEKSAHCNAIWNFLILHHMSLH